MLPYSEGGTRGTLTQCHQRVSEWSVMREVVWSLMCPVSTHVFISNKEGQFRVREGITLPSLTPVSTTSPCLVTPCRDSSL